MVRSLWKGKCLYMDYTNIWFQTTPKNRFVQLKKNNLYVFQEFKNLTFNVYRGNSWNPFFITHLHTGFVLGVFIMTRETRVVHNVKKSKKQRAKEQQLLAKQRKNKRGNKIITYNIKKIKKKKKDKLNNKRKNKLRFN